HPAEHLVLDQQQVARVEEVAGGKQRVGGPGVGEVKGAVAAKAIGLGGGDHAEVSQGRGRKGQAAEVAGTASALARSAESPAGPSSAHQPARGPAGGGILQAPRQKCPHPGREPLWQEPRARAGSPRRRRRNSRRSSSRNGEGPAETRTNGSG